MNRICLRLYKGSQLGKTYGMQYVFFKETFLKTYSGLEFTYELRRGRNGGYTKELRHWGQTL